MRTTKTLIRLCGCAGLFESSLGAHVERYMYIVSHCGSLYVCLVYVHQDETQMNNKIDLQSNFNGLIIFGTTEISSRHGSSSH